MKSIVWWASTDYDGRLNALEKFTRLIRASGFLNSLEETDRVAIKLHMSELGNTRGLRPIWARRIADLVKKAGAKPFVTDTTTLYRHRRTTAHDYLETAAHNGFTTQSMGCPIIIADGLGRAAVMVTQEDADFREVSVAQAIYEANAMVVLSHPTFHPEFPIACSVKNVGMGCTTRAAKILMHGHIPAPILDQDRCKGCFTCWQICPGEAFIRRDGFVELVEEKCIGCGDCVAYCPHGALRVAWDHDCGLSQKWTLDACRAVLSTFEERKVLHTAVGTDVTHACDCMTTSPPPMVADIGLFASYDPVALDYACWEKIHEAALYPGGELDRKLWAGEVSEEQLAGDRSTPLYPETNPARFWGEIVPASRLGSMDYELRVLRQRAAT